MEQQEWPEALRVLLAPLVTALVSEALAGRERELATRPKPPLNQTEMAVALDISIPTLKKMIDEGLPWIPAGDHKRFERERVLEWLRQRSTAADVQAFDRAVGAP